MLFPDKSGTRDFAHEKHTKALEGTAVGATTGGVVGGALGPAGRHWPAGDSRRPDPLTSRPVRSWRRLSGRASGLRWAASPEQLVGLGIPELEAKRHMRDKVKNGNILISASAENSDQIKMAKEIFESAGATDIGSTSEKAAPTPEKPKHAARV